jgi:DNA-binding CsgD family transcriptional regulator
LCIILSLLLPEIGFLLKTRQPYVVAVGYASLSLGFGGAVEPENRLLDNCRKLAWDYHVTGRELDVMYTLAQGYSLSKTCEILNIANGTAGTHRRHLYEKLNIHSRSELIDMVKKYDS